MPSAELGPTLIDVCAPLTERLSRADAARVVQLSDTHLSHVVGLPARMQELLSWIAADPPDIVIHTGDIVLADPDDAADRAFARAAFETLPCPVLAIPGNHDIGFYGEDEARGRRLRAFTEAWAADRFAVDVAGWRLVGVNAYLLGEPTSDAWLSDAVSTSSPIAVFIHQPLAGDPNDGWEMPRSARLSFERATAGGDIRLVASGHRHRSRASSRLVWAPSATLVGESHDDGTDPRPGAVEFTFRRQGEVTTRFVRP